MTLTVYARGDDGLVREAADARAALAEGSAVWIDLLRPTELEEALVEGVLDIDVPTAKERAALEDSARFYEESGALVLTPTMMARREDEFFVADGVSFFLTRSRLVTVREIEPRAFKIGQGRASARIESANSGGAVMVALLEGYIERVADILQEGYGKANALSASIFARNAARTADMRACLAELGRLGAFTTQCRESLSALQRMAAFASQVCSRYGLTPESFSAISRDARQLDAAAGGLQGQLTFLLDAALGLVSEAQNVSLQRLSVAAVLFVPPTLIASIFGMNFEAMSWFREPWGPWLAVLLMMAASAGMFAAARARRWI